MRPESAGYSARSSMVVYRIKREDVFSAEKRRTLAAKAVNRLIADIEAKRLPQNKELAETITACICEARSRQLRALRWLLEEQDIESIDREKNSRKTTKRKSENQAST
jgi:hypothetical protein